MKKLYFNVTAKEGKCILQHESIVFLVFLIENAAVEAIIHKISC